MRKFYFTFFTYFYAQFNLLQILFTPVQSGTSKARVYLSNLQTRFSWKGSAIWKMFILYFRFIFSFSSLYKIIPHPIVPLITQHPVYTAMLSLVSTKSSISPSFNNAIYRVFALLPASFFLVNGKYQKQIKELKVLQFSMINIISRNNFLYMFAIFFKKRTFNFFNRMPSVNLFRIRINCFQLF